MPSLSRRAALGGGLLAAAAAGGAGGYEFLRAGGEPWSSPRHRGARVTAVAAASPAVPTSAVWSLVRGVRDIPTQLTCGRDDHFAEATRRLLRGLRRTSSAETLGGIPPGCHDAAFRRRMLPDQMRFFGRHFT
jgi:hypothetical protein